MKARSGPFLPLSFLLYLAVLVKFTLIRTSVTLFEVTFSEHNGYITSFQSAMHRANFIPFHSIDYYLVSRQEPLEVGLVNVLGNVLLFIPFGLLLPLIGRRFQTAGPTLLVIFLTSSVFEVLQLLLAIGNFDVDDTLLNTLGGVLGYTLYSRGKQIAAVNRGSRQ